MSCGGTAAGTYLAQEEVLRTGGCDNRGYSQTPDVQHPREERDCTLRQHVWKSETHQTTQFPASPLRFRRDAAAVVGFSWFEQVTKGLANSKN